MKPAKASAQRSVNRLLAAIVTGPFMLLAGFWLFVILMQSSVLFIAFFIMASVAFAVLWFKSVSRVTCPYCDANISGFIQQNGTRWVVPVVMDICWQCHRDLTVPYQEDREPVEESRRQPKPNW